jgi:alpha-L-rhamnosidase
LFVRTSLVLLSLSLAAPVFAAAIRPNVLRVEYLVDPQGIDVTAPRLSWELTASNPNARGLHQTAYRVLAASTEAALAAAKADLWDSGKVDSAQSNQIVYRGKDLVSGAPVFWKVQVWDEDSKPSEWSAPAHWSMGLLQPGDWQGKWIGRDEPADYQDPASPYQILKGAHWISDKPATPGSTPGSPWFRTAFTIPGGRKIADAIVIAGGDRQAEVFLNGKSIAFRSRAEMPLLVDVSSQLKSGENILSVHDEQPSADRPAAMIAAVRVAFASGEPLLILSNKSWTASTAAEPEATPTVWNAAVELGPYGMEPWGQAGLTWEHRLPARYLRKEFTVPKKVAHATVYYSGLGLSELYLNGAKVGDRVLSPGLTDYSKRALYVTFDVTNRLVDGKNAIGLILGNGRYYTPRNDGRTRTFGFPKAMVELNIEYADGSHASVVSDTTWKLTTGGPIRANNEYDGEEYDARRELTGWDRTGFNDSQWQAAQEVAAPEGPLVAEMANPLREKEVLHPLSVKQLRPGVWIYDMGQNMVGWCRLRVSGPKGAAVRLRFAETLAPDGGLYVANLRTAMATDLYTLKGGGPEVWQPRFTYHGFRYVELTGWPGSAAPTAATLEGHVVHDDMPAIADFSSSSDILNRIHHNVLWGIRGNYRSIPTDCPQRDERQGWLGDRSQGSRSESYMYDVAAFYTKWEQDIADSQKADGSVPDVSPNYWQNYHDDVTWPATFVLLPGMLYDQYGDTRVIERFYPAMTRWMEHERSFVQDGLIPKDTYGDWCVPPEDPKLIHSQDPARVTNGTLIASAYYYHLLRLMAKYARILDKPSDAGAFEAEADALDSAFQKRFFRPVTGLYDNGTQTSSVLPLYFGMAPENTRGSLVTSLAGQIENVTHGHIGTGLIGAQFLMRTLSDNGRSDLAYEIATQKTYPSWGYMVEKGATTIWELWNGDTADPAMNSGNHVMLIGDLGVWMYEYLAGIRSDPSQPGFRHAVIHPYPAGDLTFVSASHESMYGKLESSWKREAHQFRLDLTVPPGTTATVWLPAKDAAEVTEGGHPAAGAPGVKFVRNESNSALFDVGSGIYHFSVEFR